MRRFALLTLSSALLSSFAIAAPTTDSSNNFTNAQKSEIQNIVHDYLIKNPEVLIEASRILQQRERTRMTEKAQKAIPRLAKKLFSAPENQIGGNPNGNTTIVEFFDYQCGYCKQVAPMLKQMVEKDKNIRVIYKNFPIFGPNSELAAKAVMAAAQQNKYLELHEALITLDKPLDEQVIFDTAKSVGLDIDKLKKDINASEINAQLEENQQLAEQLGLVGTPAFIVASYPVTKQMKYFFVPGLPNQNILQNLIDATRGKKLPTA